MRPIHVTEQTPLAEALGDADEEVLILRGGRVVALLVPFDDEVAAWYAKERDAGFIASVAEAREQVRQGQTVSHDELKARLGIE